jgi:hypothetical protein
MTTLAMAIARMLAVRHDASAQASRMQTCSATGSRLSNGPETRCRCKLVRSIESASRNR